MAKVGSAFVTIIPSAKGFGRNLDGGIGPDLDRSGRTAVVVTLPAPVSRVPVLRRHTA
jgi:hypothetical protein